MKYAPLLSVSSLICVVGLGVSQPAHADSRTCDLLAPDMLMVDGLLDDWGGIGQTHVGGKDRDVSYSLRCAYDDQHLYLAIEVRDDYLYRGQKPSPRKDDHLRIELGSTSASAGKRSWSSGRLIVYPGNDKNKRKRLWNGGKLPGWLVAEDSLQRRGWALELSVPLTRIKGYGQSSAAIRAHIEYRDADYAAKIEAKVPFAGQLEFQAASELYGEFLSSTGLSADDITLDKMANMDGKPGLERVIVGRDVIGVISDGFSYMKLPVASPTDVRKVQLARLGKDDMQSVITEYRQHGNGGSRDLVVVWQQSSGSLQAVFSFESRKQKDGKSLVNRWSLAPRGKYRKGLRKASKRARGNDLIIEVNDKDVSGWDEDNYHERPANDVTPILLPWSDQTSAVYYFDGNAAQGGAPISGKRRR